MMEWLARYQKKMWHQRVQSHELSSPLDVASCLIADGLVVSNLRSHIPSREKKLYPQFNDLPARGPKTLRGDQHRQAIGNSFQRFQSASIRCVFIASCLPLYNLISHCNYIAEIEHKCWLDNKIKFGRNQRSQARQCKIIESQRHQGSFMYSIVTQHQALHNLNDVCFLQHQSSTARK